jgi:hypothetical protein
MPTTTRWSAELEALEQSSTHPAPAMIPRHKSVGFGSGALFSPVTHAERMFSLDNVFSTEEMTAWLEKIQSVHPGATYLCELKVDGLALNLRYEAGRLVSAATRGDGVTGEDVTENALMVPSIPRTLEGSDHPELVEVRGEVVFPRAAFDALNAAKPRREKKSSPTRVMPPLARCAKRVRAKLPRNALLSRSVSRGSRWWCTALGRGIRRRSPPKARCMTSCVVGFAHLRRGESGDQR